MYELLEAIDDPKALRQLRQTDLPVLADELRSFLIESVGQTGGHLASNLGCVELTLALHYVYNTPEDKLVWDVGHQTYTHKILTGRKASMRTLRQQGGLSGFPKRDESSYDTFGVGHSSTSIGAALGMAVAAQLQGDTVRRHVAIIGDGALTAGQAFEGLNNAGAMQSVNLLVVLNDNEMSISPNVGALTNYLSQLLSSRLYNAVRQGSRKVLSILPSVKQIAGKVEENVKGMLTPGILFEQFGFNYIGPVDGHDLNALVATLRNIRRLKGPQFLHVVTRKGRGYALAEKNPIAYHGVTPFDPTVGLTAKKQPVPLTYTAVFSQWLCDMAQLDSRLVAITPAMREGSGLVDFSQQFPTRYFDVGIGEQHAITFAAGLACEGLKPVVAIYSTFLQRGYDQLIHDVALQNLPVLFAIDRAGLVGEDGPTHAGIFDLTYLRCVPHMAIMTPSDENECRQMLYTAFQHEGPCAVRYPRGYGIGVEPIAEMTALPWGRGVVCREGLGQVGILVFGGLLAQAMQAAEAFDASVADMRFVKPLDETLIDDFAKYHTLLVCVEENVTKGGAGAGVLEYLQQQQVKLPVLLLGLPDSFIEQANHAQQLAQIGLDAQGIEKAIHAYAQQGHFFD